MIAILTQPIVVILLAIILVLIIALIVLLCTRPKVVELSDDLPGGAVNRAAIMKLQNEIAPYVYIKNDKVCLKVIK